MSKKKKSGKNPQSTPAATKENPPVAPLSAASTGSPQSNVSRYISLGLLIAIILIFVFLFYEVMAQFVVPLFLAALLVVVFRPLHQWILAKCGGRETLGALITTAAIMLAVLVPICLLLVLAAAEGRAAFRQFNTAQIYDGVQKVRTSLKLDLPKSVQVIETELEQAQQAVGLGVSRQTEHARLLGDVCQSAKQISEENSLPWNELPAPSQSASTEQAPPETPWEAFTESILGLSRTGFSFLGSVLLGTAIMTIGLYFFLLDGPKMLQSVMGLSPIDDSHEKELATEFARVSRAVVVATLLSALVQGLLAGIGFYFAGLNSIFLLTVLSAVLAMVPFVGAAAVWVPCCLYLFFFQNDVPTAIGLAIYGVAIISMADNVIKPYVLHGQSNLHPLLALLSVLGRSWRSRDARTDRNFGRAHGCRILTNVAQNSATGNARPGPNASVGCSGQLGSN